jgi:predicted ATP-grasp superfamily ATP-dependent carboligase
MFTNISMKRSIPLTHKGIPQAQRALLAYLHDINYTGLFHTEWKKDPRDCILKLLEINARSSGGNYFGVACGMSHVLDAYHDALDTAPDRHMQYDVNKYHINLLRDLQILLSKLASRSLAEWSLQPYFQKKLWFIFTRHDALPFIKSITTILRSPKWRELIARDRH